MTDQTAPQDGDLFSDDLVRSYVANPRFLRRDWLAAEVDVLRTTPGCRFVLLTAEPGAGKSTFMAQLAADHPDWPRYFIRRDQREPLSDVGSRSFLLRIGFQLAARYPELFDDRAVRLSVEQRIGDVAGSGEAVGAESDKIVASPFHSTVVEIRQWVSRSAGSVTGLRIGTLAIEPHLIDPLDLQHMALIDPARAMQRLHPERQIVVLVDALDEVRYHQAQDNILAWLRNCPDLPPNVRFVLASRPPEGEVALFMEKQRSALQRIDLAAGGDAANGADARTASLRQRAADDAVAYVDALLRDPRIKPRLETLAGGSAMGAVRGEASFRERAVAKADGNIGYLDALARAIDRALAQDDDAALVALLSAKSLPDDMMGLYGFFLHQIKQGVARQRVEMVDPQSGETYDKPAWSAIYAPLLAVLAVAREPVTLEQIQRLGGITASWSDLSDAKDGLLQFLDLVGDRYRLYHATLPEFLIDPHTKESPALQDLYVDAPAWHGRIAAHYWRTHRADWSLCDGYGLRHLPTHLFGAGRSGDLSGLLLGYGWLQAKLAATDISRVVGDYDLLPAAHEARMVRDALRLAAHVLARDRAQLPGQLVGRLSSFDSASLRALVDGARAWRGAPWLCPLIPSLDAPGGPLRRTLKGRAGGHAGTPRSVAITPDGRWAISAGNSSNDQTVRVWDLETGECRHILPNQAAPGGHTPVALAAGGDLALTGYEDELRAWDLLRGVLHDTLRVEGQTVLSISLAGDGRRSMALFADGSVRIWVPGQDSAAPLPGQHEGVQAMAMCPDGRWAVTASESRIVAWDLQARSECGALKAPEGSPFDVRTLVLAPDGRSLLFGSPLRRWDIGQHSAVEVPVDGMGAIWAVTPDGRRALAQIDDKTLGLWDVPGRTLLLRMEHEGFVSCAAMTPDGARAITADFEHDLRVWDLTAAPTTGPASALAELRFVAFAAQGQAALFAAPDGALVLRDTEQGLPLPDSDATRATIRQELSDAEARAAVQDSVTADLQRLLAPPGGERRGRRGADNRRAYLGITEGRLAVAVAAGGQRAISAPRPRGKYGDFEEARQAGPEASQQEVTLWDLGDTPVRRSLRGHSTPVTALDISPDGRLAVTGCWGRIVRAWDLDAGAERWALRGHEGIVSSVSIAADGRRGASAGEDSTARMWNLETGQPIATFTGEGWMALCQVSPDGRAMVAQESSGRLHILKLCGVDDQVI